VFGEPSFREGVLPLTIQVTQRFNLRCANMIESSNLLSIWSEAGNETTVVRSRGQNVGAKFRFSSSIPSHRAQRKALYMKVLGQAKHTEIKGDTCISPQSCLCAS